MIRKDSSRMQITIQREKERLQYHNQYHNLIPKGFWEKVVVVECSPSRWPFFLLLGLLLTWAEKNYKNFHFLKTFEIVIDLLFDTTQGNEVSPGRVAMLIPAEENSEVVLAVVTIIDLFTPYADSHSGMGSGFWNWR